MVYLLCSDLVTAARALMTTWSDCHRGLPTGCPAGLLHCLQLVWNAVAHPLRGVGNQDQISCLSSPVWFWLTVWWVDSQLVLQIFNEEQTLFWSGTAEKQGTVGRCCFWQKWWQDQAEQLVRVHLLWEGKKKKEYLLTAKLIIVFVSLQSTALISKSYVLQITEFGIIVAKDLKDSCCCKP